MIAIKNISLCLLALAFSFGLQAQVKPHKKTVKSSKPSAISMTNGKAIYSKICITCHQADGGGVQNMNPPLIKTTYVLGDKTKLIGIVLNGFNESVEINGDTYSNVMAAHNYLKDQEVADVLTYVRNSFGNKASTVTAAEVKKVRAAKK